MKPSQEQGAKKRRLLRVPNFPSGRRRKRDVVADAVTGGLASGIGWVLGATPVNQQQR